MNKTEALELLEAKNQAHIMKGFDTLTAEKQAEFLAQIENINWGDFELIAGNEACENRGPFEVPAAVECAEIEARHDEFEAIGLEAIQKGEVAAVLLAGGMGTRLGFDLPKGCYNVGVTRELYIFECLINNLMKVVEKAGCFIPFYVMTSEKNDENTRKFFKEHNYFGYDESYVRFFIQDMACAVDYNGKLLLEESGRLATSPNGNGGWFASMVKAGLDKDLHKRGVKWINIFAVDNVLQQIADPVFV